MQTFRAHWACVALGLTTALGAARQAEPRTPSDLAEAIALIPEYSGRQRYFLTTDKRADVSRAIEKLRAVGASGGTDAWSALRYLEVCLALLAEDAKNRGDSQASRERLLEVVDVCSRALEIKAGDPWTHYARGMALHNLRAHRSAAAEFGEAIDLAALVSRSAEPPVDPIVAEARDVHYRATYRLGDSLMRIGDSDAAALAFAKHFERYAAPEWHEWELQKALGEMFLFLHDFDAADQAFARLSANPRFESYSYPYEVRGYVALTKQDKAAADVLLWKAIGRGQEPSDLVYPWISRWTLGVHAHDRPLREEAEDELADILLQASISDWDRTLIAYLLWPEAGRIAERKRSDETQGEFARRIRSVVSGLGPGDDASFVALSDAERRRRAASDEDPGFVSTETWYFIGVRREHLASAQEGEQRTIARIAALDAYRRALETPIHEFNWELEYARVRAAVLSQELKLPAAPLADELRSSDMPIVLHRVSSSRAIRLESLREYEPLVGDHLYFTRVEAGVECTDAVIVLFARAASAGGPQESR